MECVTWGIISGMAAAVYNMDYIGELIMELITVGIISGMAASVGTYIGISIGRHIYWKRQANKSRRDAKLLSESLMKESRYFEEIRARAERDAAALSAQENVVSVSDSAKQNTSMKEE